MVIHYFNKELIPHHHSYSLSQGHKYYDTFQKIYIEQIL